MASGPKTITTTNTVVNNRTGVTTSHSVTKSGNSTTITNTKTIGKAKTVSKPGGTVSKGKTVSPVSKAAGTVLADTRWITGPNTDGWTMCGSVAVANCLLAATGIEASNGDIERLYRAAGASGDTGAPMEFLFAAAASTGLAGCRLATWAPAARITDAGVALMLVHGVPDVHAAAITADGAAVMWGDEVPLASLDALVLDAWSLAWH